MSRPDGLFGVHDEPHFDQYNEDCVNGMGFPEDNYDVPRQSSGNGSRPTSSAHGSRPASNAGKPARMPAFDTLGTVLFAIVGLVLAIAVLAFCGWALVTVIGNSLG